MWAKYFEFTEQFLIGFLDRIKLSDCYLFIYEYEHYYMIQSF